VDEGEGRLVDDGLTGWGGVFALAGLASLAITQPLLDLMGSNPEFFVAGSYTTAQIVWFGVIVALVPSVVLAVVFLGSHLAHRGLGRVVLVLLTAALGALFGNVLARGLGLDNALVALLASVVGAAAAVLLVRARAGRMLLQYLAVANVFFLVAFLFMSPVSALVSADVDPGALGTTSVPVPPGPVVVIVFDELPMPTLMHADGSINAARYPAFARLAEGSTWFRNASSPHNRTERALPAIVTGNVIRERTMPTFNELPRNLLSLMGTSVPVERYEALTDLCPRDTCAERGGKPLRAAIEDSLVVYGHRVLPPRLREELAPIDDAWGDFGGGVRGARVPAPTADPGTSAQDPFATENPLARWHGSEQSERSPATQAARLVEQGLAIDGEPALHFIHVVLPHAPWSVTPWATTLMDPMPEWDDDGTGDDAAWSSLIRYQRHSWQTGAADVALGQVLDHLQTTGVWDDATVLVTADHGTSTLPPDVARVATENNKEEVFRVPLFLKAPGQQQANVVDDVAMTIDALPTLLDVLDIETDWEMEGHSLLDGSQPTVEPLVDPDVEALFAVVDRHAADFPHGWDWTSLAAVGEHGSLVGTALADLAVGEPSPRSWTPNDEAAFASLPSAVGEAPQLVTGVVEGSAAEEPPSVLLVVNGTVAGVAGGYDPGAGGWTFSAALGPYLVAGANTIEAFEVTVVDGRPELHRLG
jgi:hypothetical protein